MNIIGTVTPKTDVSSLISALFADASRHLHCGMNQDCEYLLQRYNAEGDKFLYTVLPLLGKAVEKSLITECNVCIPEGFALFGHSKLPRFLHTPFSRVYHEDGSLRLKTEMDCKSVEVIRQITLFWSKVHSTAKEDWSSVIEDFRTRITTKPDIKRHPALGYARKFLRILFSELSPEFRAIRDFQTEPWGRHGPGAVAHGERGNDKWFLESVSGFPSNLYDVNQRIKLDRIPNTSSLASRMILVPKDFRGPRIICAEPKECQFGQQGLKDVLYRYLENHYLTRDHICFSDVSRNRQACFDNNLSTIDLKDASDRLSLAAVRLLFPKHMCRLLTQYRSRRCSINGEETTYAAFATMGSALCFPVQTVAFLAICKGVQWYWNSKLSRSHYVDPRIFVFGDDIICDTAMAPHVMEALEALGLMVNRDKTSLGTTVKESCGEWVLNGISQVIVKPKTICVDSTEAYLAVRQNILNLREKGWFAAAQVFVDTISPIIAAIPRRYNRKYQRLEWRCPVLIEDGQTGELRAEYALYNYFTHIESVNIMHKQSRSTMPFLHGALVRAKRRWQAEDPSLIF